MIWSSSIKVFEFKFRRRNLFCWWSLVKKSSGFTDDHRLKHLEFAQGQWHQVAKRFWGFEQRCWETSQAFGRLATSTRAPCSSRGPQPISLPLPRVIVNSLGAEWIFRRWQRPPPPFVVVVRGDSGGAAAIIATYLDQNLSSYVPYLF